MRGRLLGMLLLLALGQWFFLAPAYAGDAPSYGSPAEPVQVMHPSSLPQGINYPPTPMPRALPASVTQPEEPEQGVKAWLRKYRLCCWSSHDSPGCGSFKAECTFIFGSCRK